MLSMIKNKKIMTVIGGILIVIGIAGMVAVGLNLAWHHIWRRIFTAKSRRRISSGRVCIYVHNDSRSGFGDIFTDHTAVTKGESKGKKKLKQTSSLSYYHYL